MTGLLELTEVKPEDKTLLWNIHQKYLYEMTNFYDNEMDAQGNYHYGYFDAYFREPERKALFLFWEGHLAGFAMLNPYSYIGKSPDHVLAEFTVFPRYRRKHIASEAADLIFRQNKGSWEVKYNEANAPAKALWTKVTAKYCPQRIPLNPYETVLSFCVE